MKNKSVTDFPEKKSFINQPYYKKMELKLVYRYPKLMQNSTDPSFHNNTCKSRIQIIFNVIKKVKKFC